MQGAVRRSSCMRLLQISEHGLWLLLLLLLLMSRSSLPHVLCCQSIVWVPAGSTSLLQHMTRDPRCSLLDPLPPPSLGSLFLPCARDNLSERTRRRNLKFHSHLRMWPPRLSRPQPPSVLTLTSERSHWSRSRRYLYAGKKLHFRNLKYHQLAWISFIALLSRPFFGKTKNKNAWDRAISRRWIC